MTVWELLEFLQTRKTTDIVYVGNNDWKEISVSAPADYFTALSDNEVTIVWNINSFYDDVTGESDDTTLSINENLDDVIMAKSIISSLRLLIDKQRINKRTDNINALLDELSKLLYIEMSVYRWICPDFIRLANQDLGQMQDS